MIAFGPLHFIVVVSNQSLKAQAGSHQPADVDFQNSFSMGNISQFILNSVKLIVPTNIS